MKNHIGIGAALFFLLSGCGLLLPRVAYQPVYNINQAKEKNEPSLNGKIAVNSIVRVSCPQNGETGTGFIHKSGNIITAAHVIAECPTKKILLQVNDEVISVSEKKYDTDSDVAILYPNKSVGKIPVILLSREDRYTYGEQVSIWGYPDVVTDKEPKLIVGYLSGFDSQYHTWDINAPISPGMSGAPVYRLSDGGTIIGMVSGKMQSAASELQQAISILKAKGTPESIATANAFDRLRHLTQYNLGYAIPASWIRIFLTENGVEP